MYLRAFSQHESRLTRVNSPEITNGGNCFLVIILISLSTHGMRQLNNQLINSQFSRVLLIQARSCTNTTMEMYYNDMGTNNTFPLKQTYCLINLNISLRVRAKDVTTFLPACEIGQLFVFVRCIRKFSGRLFLQPALINLEGFQLGNGRRVQFPIALCLVIASRSVSLKNT